MFSNLPLTTPGLRVGLLGGSFDPPHAGHMHISRWALKEFGLDQVWWLVSPGNPLKAKGPAPLERRMAACRELVNHHPRIVVTDIEAQFGTRYTAATLARLFKRAPNVRFVWLMGADNLANFHRWEKWSEIMKSIPIGVLARPGEQIRAGCSPAARSYHNNRLPARRSTALPFRKAPCWALLTGPMMDMSSSEIRARGDWQG